KITGFGAAPTEEGKDAIVISGDLPVLRSRAEGSGASYVQYKSVGVVSFIYNPDAGAWSDHYNVELFDRAGTHLSRNFCRVSAVNGYLFAVCYGTDGSETRYTETIHIYRSRDG